VSKDIRKALQWIVRTLHEKKIPFYISGGFAAVIYGSPRTIKDIDIDIPEKYFERALLVTKKYLSWGPKHVLKKPWGVHVFTLTRFGCEVDISAGDTMRFYDLAKKKWVKGKWHLAQATRTRAFGVVVPIIPRKDLLFYKKLLQKYGSRKHQGIDVKALSAT
jgi:hypothetical protein